LYTISITNDEFPSELREVEEDGGEWVRLGEMNIIGEEEAVLLFLPFLSLLFEGPVTTLSLLLLITQLAIVPSS
jgi:hypothetical protein